MKVIVKEGIKKDLVELKAKDVENANPVSFDIKQANKILSSKNPQWELVDKGYVWNGTEIAIAIKTE